jgi:hypothetical protein
VELAQDVVEHRAFVKRRFGVFGITPGSAQVARNALRRSRRVLTEPSGSLRNRMASKPCSTRCSVAVVAAWVLSSPTTSQANSGILRSISTIGRPTAAGGSGHLRACRPR